MGRSFGFSDAWAKNAQATENGTQVAESGDAVQSEVAPLIDPETGEKLYDRTKAKPGTDSGMWDDEVRAGDNLLNKIGRERDYNRGTLVEEFIERDQSGEIVGTREVTWERTDDSGRTMVLTKSRFKPGGSRRYFVMG